MNFSTQKFDYDNADLILFEVDGVKTGMIFTHDEDKDSISTGLKKLAESIRDGKSGIFVSTNAMVFHIGLASDVKREHDEENQAIQER